MDPKKESLKLDELQKRITVYNNIIDLIVHDAATVAPVGSVGSRREMLSEISRLRYQLIASDETRDLIAAARERYADADPLQKRITDKLQREYDSVCGLPQELYVRYDALISDADAVWREAKQANDYARFAPYIDEMVGVMKEMAQTAAPEKDPYDYWLDKYQEGMNRSVCDPFFDTLGRELPPVIREITARPQIDDACLRGEFPVAKQTDLAYMLMDLVGIDRRYCVLGETEHPFTSMLTRDDVRVTTHYYTEDFTRSMFSVMHECGHAMFELNLPEPLVYTAAGWLRCASVHESQSRFYENYVGRSREFITAMQPKLAELFPSLSGVSADTLYRAMNRCTPGQLRMGADELTYPLHIMVRYTLEKALFRGELTSKGLNEEWNRLYRELLNVDVTDDAHGILQDLHWSNGLIGYFPSYAFGSAYGAQYLARMRKSFDFDACVAKAELTPVSSWLNEHIWQYGASKDFKTVLEDAFAGPFDPMYYVDYLKNKFGDIYRL